MEMMKEIQHALLDKAHEQIDNLDNVCTEEYGEVIKMIKGLSEAMYYCAIVEAMEEGKDVTQIAVQTATNNIAQKV